jgi:prolyl-tRNA editing enzyme YbaK/EbsC (Cys-tRNA(Pro) deacylase)
MTTPLSPSVQKVQDALEALGISIQVVQLQATTRTSADAARAVGCRVEQIAKSLVFQTMISHRPLLVIASGSNRVNEERIAGLISEPIGKADADFVRRHTGFVIGGVPPVGHIERLDIFIDQDLLQHEEIWAAAGSPHAVFKLTPQDLVKMTGGLVTSIK